MTLPRIKHSGGDVVLEGYGALPKGEAALLEQALVDEEAAAIRAGDIALWRAKSAQVAECILARRHAADWAKAGSAQ